MDGRATVAESPEVRTWSPCWILTSPRSGSNWFSRSLDAYARSLLAPSCRPLLPVASLVYNHVLQRERPGATIEMIEHENPGIRFVWLWRENLIEQAVSLLIACRTGATRSYDPQTIEVARKVGVEASDEELLERYQEVASYRENWRYWLQHHEYMSVTYESLWDRIAIVVPRVLEYLGAGPCPIRALPQLTVRTEHAASRELCERLVNLVASRERARAPDEHKSERN